MTWTSDKSLKGADVRHRDLTGARFTECDFTDVVLRGVDTTRMDVDAPWLESTGGFLVNGVDVTAYVVAELDRRFPGRGQRSAQSAVELRIAWAALEAAWAPVLERVAAMPDGTVDVRVAGEWSFAQTLRHLVLATDMWLTKPVLRRERPFHPLGLLHDGGEDEHDVSVFATGTPTYDAVLEARADRVAMVRDYLADVTDDVLDERRANPHDPRHDETVRSCLHTILEEEWEHLRFALRDLDAIDRAQVVGPAPPGGTDP